MFPTTVPDSCNIENPIACPVDMKCYPVGLSPEGDILGQCGCFRHLSLTTKLPLTEEQEQTGQFECVPSYNSPRYWVTVVVLFFLLFFSLHAIYMFVQTMVRMKKAKVLRNNAAGRLLVLFVGCGLVVTYNYVVFLLNHFQLDPGLYQYNVIRVYMVFVFTICVYAVTQELVVAWLDLTEKTINLSKNSSKRIFLFKFFLRLYCFGGSLALVVMLVQGNLSAVVMFSSVFYIIFLFLMIFSGWKIQTMLCPDLKDKNHPNVEPAKAIKFVYINFPAYFFGYFILSTLYSMFLPLGLKYGNLSLYFQMFYYVPNLLGLYNILSYVQFGARRALKPYECEERTLFTRALQRLTWCYDYKAPIEKRKSMIAEAEAAAAAAAASNSAENNA